MTAEPMPADRLTEIRARHEATTSGTWEHDGPYYWPVRESPTGVISVDERTFVMLPHPANPLGEEDLRFAVHAHADVPDLLAEVERLRCTDPIECGHEAALGQAQAEVERLNGVVQFLGSHLQRDSMEIVDELRRQAAQEPLLPIEDVERFLKRERDQHGKESYWWRSVDDVLDAFRLHMVTGTPLTDPRPTDGPEAPGVGPKPLTEAEELRAERDRLRHALDRAALSIKHDLGSSACLLREAQQESMKPWRRRPAQWGSECPACDVAAALNPGQVQP